ncbi:MAG TPA: DUF305 domain-containing protein [Sphingomonadaceae bacterium]|nr:DUF305 domain-containing protein [Sphingomonadaceae bacterium]
MKTAHLAPLALLLVAGCAQPAGDDAKSANANTTGNAASGASMPADHSAHGGTTDHMAAMTPQADDSAATRGYKQLMSRMMDGMPPYTGDADVDFNKQMRVHHIAAIEMGEVQLAHGKDAESRALATKIIADQKREVAQIDAWLAKRGQ